MGVQATSKFRQFCDVRDAFGKVTRHGQTFTWDTVPMMSRANRQLTETNTLPQGNHTVVQGTLTMNECGFSVPFTEMLESMSEFTVRQPIMKVLKYDAMCYIDALAHQQFNKTAIRAAATATADAVTLVSNSSATVVSTLGMALNHVKSIVDTMKTRNIPYYTDRDYFAIARPYGLRQLKNQLETIHQYTDSGLEMIMNGEIGRYETVRFVEQTVIPAGGANDSTTFDPFTDTADAWNNNPTLADWCFFFGADTVCEAVHTEEEIRAKIPDDYGRSKGVAWYALLGYGITHNDANNLAQTRIIKFDSGS
jgi:N4-gp56 family major capsid protein